jgi:hypothetical protein
VNTFWDGLWAYFRVSLGFLLLVLLAFFVLWVWLGREEKK